MTNKRVCFLYLRKQLWSIYLRMDVGTTFVNPIHCAYACYITYKYNNTDVIISHIVTKMLDLV